MTIARRQFLKYSGCAVAGVAAGAAGLFGAPGALGGAAAALGAPPSEAGVQAGALAAARARARIARGEKLRLAIIGVANQGGANLDQVKGKQIVALCDVDANYLAAAAKQFPGAKTFKDFRELFADDSLDLDGAVISTPDHTHTPAAARALQRGLAVYLEKPLTHTIEECRLLQSLAARHGNVTQMGTLIHAGDNYRRVVEAIQAGVIGPITQVDTWCPKSWCCGALTPGRSAPPTLDWDLWQGPIAPVPFIDGIAPANWRKYWAYGTGTLGDMGCHIIDLPFWALRLNESRGSKFTVSATGTPIDATGCPTWLEATWVLPGAAPPGGDPLIVRWFDGGRVPPTVQELGAKDRKDYFGRFMVCFQGTRGFLMANYGEMEILQAPDATLPAKSIASSAGHHVEWLESIRSGKPVGEGSPLCRFEYAAPLTEMVLMGTVAYRAGKQVPWDRGAALDQTDASMRPLLTETWRPGWAITSS